MEISNPRRILAVSLEDSTVHLTKVIKDLTGTHPEQTSTSLAGTTHNLSIKTAYYTAEVPLWIDLIASPAEWAESFLSPEAKEVLDVLGGLIVVFALPQSSSSALSSASSAEQVKQPPSSSLSETEASADTAGITSSIPASSDTPPTTSTKETESSSSDPSPSKTTAKDPDHAAQARDLLQNLGRVVQDGLGGWSWDGVSLCLGVGEADDVDEWEELAAGCGLEFVQIKNRTVAERNEFGEKTGIPRVLEALESNDWDQGNLDELDSDLDDFGNFGDDNDDDDEDSKFKSGNQKGTDIDPESLDFGFDRADFEGLKRAIWTSGQEIDDEVDMGVAAGTTSSGTGGGAGAKDGGEKQGGNEDKIDDEDVEKIERMMLKLSAVRDMAAGLPEDQRRRMAAKAVNEVMKEL